jgi:Fic family protein
MYKPKFTITNNINKCLLEIERARGFLDAANLKEEWIKDMQSEALIVESHYSTHIEGTELSLSQAQKILSGRAVRGINRDDRQELLNYKTAMNFIAEYLGVRSEISEELIKRIHSTLVHNVRGGTLEPGQYRKVQNYIVNSLSKEVIYTPPPYMKIPKLMEDFVGWLNSETNVSPVLIAGISQFRFVDIHPFLDGNGRTARVLCTLVLYQHGYDFKRLFSLSEYYDKDRNKYYDAVQSVREDNNDLTAWLEYFTEGLRRQLIEVKEKGELSIKREIISSKAGKLNLNQRQQELLNHFLEANSASVEELRKKFNLVRRTVQRDLSRFVELGLIEVVSKSKTDPTKHYKLL